MRPSSRHGLGTDAQVTQPVHGSGHAVADGSDLRAEDLGLLRGDQRASSFPSTHDAPGHIAETSRVEGAEDDHREQREPGAGAGRVGLRERHEDERQADEDVSNDHTAQAAQQERTPADAVDQPERDNGEGEIDDGDGKRSDGRLAEAGGAQEASRVVPGISAGCCGGDAHEQVEAGELLGGLQATGDDERSASGEIPPQPVHERRGRRLVDADVQDIGLGPSDGKLDDIDLGRQQRSVEGHAPCDRWPRPTARGRCGRVSIAPRAADPA